MDHFVEFEDVCKYYQTGSVKINSTSCTLIIIRLGSMLIFDTPYIKSLHSARHMGVPIDSHGFM